MIVNIAGYHFAHLTSLAAMRQPLLDACTKQNLKGTILVSPEGINAFLAGTRESINTILALIRTYPGLEKFAVKESFSEKQPFRRMLVRLKKEVIAFGIDKANPLYKDAPRVSPEQLKTWLDQGEDLVLLDTRNDFEVNLGTFENAEHFGIQSFKGFIEAVKAKKPDWENKKIVTFCTGGVRCEKAAPFMNMVGFKDVYQLDGGILKYFEDCGSKHYTGDCFVFDQRVALDSNLQPTQHALCYECRSVLNHPGAPCPKCSDSYQQPSA
ncbi:MAG: rhodanese-like domain-containing protein [Myxococcaceae bacterium]